MCEFCSTGPSTSNRDHDSRNPHFAGFFSADAIEAAIRTARRQESNRRSSAQHDASSLSSQSKNDDESEGGEGDDDADSDGT